MRVLMAYLPCPHPHPQEDGRSPQVGMHHVEGLQGSRRDCLGQDSLRGEQRPGLRQHPPRTKLRAQS